MRFIPSDGATTDTGDDTATSTSAPTPTPDDGSSIGNETGIDTDVL